MTGQRDAARRSVAVCEMATEHCMSNQTSEGLIHTVPQRGSGWGRVAFAKNHSQSHRFKTWNELRVQPVLLPKGSPRGTGAQDLMPGDTSLVPEGLPTSAVANSSRSRKEVHSLIQDAVGEQIQIHDPQQALRGGDFQDVLDECVDKVHKVMEEDSRSELNADDRGFIARRVSQRVVEFFDQYRAERSRPTRYKRTERVVCRLDGDRQWASGAVVMVNEVNPDDGYSILPYVVKIDGPQRRLISVPKGASARLEPPMITRLALPAPCFLPCPWLYSYLAACLRPPL